MKLHVRWMIGQDLSSILEIEQGGSFPAWTGKDYRKFQSESASVALVAIVETGEGKHGEPIGPVQGLLLYDLKQRHYSIRRLMVRSSMRRKGVGSILLRSLKKKMKNSGRKEISVIVPETNLESLQFFGSQGFLAESVVRNEFGDLDGYLMRYSKESRPSPAVSPWKNRIAGMI